MRKIEQDVLNAIRARKQVKSLGNTVVRWNDLETECSVELYGHNIFAGKETLGTVELTINMCGYPTATTRSRLHAILQCHNMGVCQRKGKQYLIDNLRGERTYTELDCNAPYTIILLKD